MKLIHDNFQNYKRYQIPKAQLIIADIPYNIGTNAYASNPKWYKDGDNAKGESELAGKQFFDTDSNFNLVEFMHFVNGMLKREPKERNQAGVMIIFCAFEQMHMLINLAERYGFPKYQELIFRKNYSAQVLKANMRIVGNCEYGLLFYRDKLPKFRNGGRMIFNCMEFRKDNTTPKIHPNQKPIGLLRQLIEIFTDVGDVVIDPCAGSGVTLLAANQLGRRAYGFEIKKEFVKGFYDELAVNVQPSLFSQGG